MHAQWDVQNNGMCVFFIIIFPTLKIHTTLTFHSTHPCPNFENQSTKYHLYCSITVPSQAHIQIETTQRGFIQTVSVLLNVELSIYELCKCELEEGPAWSINSPYPFTPPPPPPNKIQKKTLYSKVQKPFI